MINYKLAFVPNHVVVFGCGGTGSRIVPLVAQFLKTVSYLTNPEMTLVDFDEVEEKNLLRQNFVKPDVGKNKAEVLASRYSRAYGINIYAENEDFTKIPLQRFIDSPAFMKLRDRLSGKGILVINCVDSIAARKNIAGLLYSMLLSNIDTHGLILIDTGNETDFGQVKIVGDHTFRSVIKDKTFTRSPFDVDIVGFPTDMEYFTSMEPPKDVRSCADLDQTMAINCMVSNAAFGTIQNIYYGVGVPYHRLNISLQHGITPEYMNFAYLARVEKTLADSELNAHREGLYAPTEWEHYLKLMKPHSFRLGGNVALEKYIEDSYQFEKSMVMAKAA